MAQVVQRRGTPAYLVVIFVVLFVISSALAVLFYVQRDDAEKRDRIKGEQLTKAKKQLGKARNEEIPSLISKITINNTDDPNEAIALADAALMQRPYASQYANTALITAIEGMAGEMAGKDKRIRELDQQIKDRLKVIEQKDAAIAKIKGDYDQQVQAVRQELADAQAAFNRDLAAKDAQLARAVQEKDAIIDQREKEKAVLAQTNDDLAMDVQNRDTRIKLLIDRLRKERGGANVGVATLLQFDGRIVKALPDQQIIFVDLGEKDNIRPGLPFAVYDKNKGVPEDGKGKAKLVVVDVGPTTCECRIVEPATQDPIVEGDLVANLVFNTRRVHQFVVEGEFDLYGEGRTDPLGNRRVRKMIEDYGGKLADQVSVDTDFVVMGVEPTSPLKPADDASPAEWRIFTDKQAKYIRYKQIRAVAASLQIPVLSTSRFLAFSGYVPKKRLTD